MFKSQLATVVPLLLLLMGCRSQRLMHDLQDFHVHLLDQQEKHIMQNLVRAKHGKPFLHFNLTEIFLDQLDTTNISGSLGETTVDKSTTTFFTGAARAGATGSSSAGAVDVLWLHTGGQAASGTPMRIAEWDREKGTGNRLY